MLLNSLRLNAGLALSELNIFGMNNADLRHRCNETTVENPEFLFFMRWSKQMCRNLTVELRCTFKTLTGFVKKKNAYHGSNIRKVVSYNLCQIKRISLSHHLRGSKKHVKNWRNASLTSLQLEDACLLPNTLFAFDFWLSVSELGSDDKTVWQCVSCLLVG